MSILTTSSSYGTHYTHLQSLANLVEARNDEEKKLELARSCASDCLLPSNASYFKELVSEGKYSAALKAIWRDSINKHRFLNELSDELHAPLMFEEAIAKFEQTPTEETVIKVAIPLIKAASLRIMQDSLCSNDRSVSEGDMATRFQMAYMESLTHLVQRHLQKELSGLIEQHEVELKAHIKETAIQVLNLSQRVTLADPSWTRFHGIQIYINPQSNSMKPSSEWKPIRDNFAVNFSSKLCAL